MTHVPYKGGGPSMIDVMSGQVEVGFGTLIQALPHLKSGKLKALGVGTKKRSPAMPDIPTISESGLPGYDASIWWGILGPAGIPTPIVHKLNTEIGAILNEADMVKRIQANAAEPTPISPEEFGKIIADELVVWARVAKETGIKAE